MRPLACVALAVLAAIACGTQAGSSPQPPTTVSSMLSDIRLTGSALIPEFEFDRGQATWSAASTATLEQVLIMLQHHTEWRFEVQVHTDELGDSAADQALTDRRAEALVAWLTERRIDSTRLVPRGLGSMQPHRVGPSNPSAARWVQLRKLNEE